MGQPKGLDWEGRVAKALRDAGLAQARRLGTSKPSDVHCAPFLIECKNEKAPSLLGAWKQAQGDLHHYDDCSVPVAVCKRVGNRKDALVVIRFDDWLDMILKMTSTRSNVDDDDWLEKLGR